MTDKHAVIELIQQLPDDATMDRILDELRILSAIRKGRVDIAAGRVKTHQEVKQMVASWAK